jgi:predicted molibdopterin-dependent oxidoreductase YjgC
MTEESAMGTLERIQFLSNLSNGLQNKELKAVFDTIPSGDLLYDIFAQAVLKEIENMMNPLKETPKDLTDTAKIAEALKQQMNTLLQTMSALNNANLLKVLGVLNHSIGGKTSQYQEAEQYEQRAPVQQQEQIEQPKYDDGGGVARSLTRGNRTGLTW